MTAAGLVFANIHDHSLSELTRFRSMASVPFGGRYRMIDFTLSAMVNSGITKIGLVTDRNYQSLLDHIGTGKDWDLARRSGGLKLISPNITAYDRATEGHYALHRLEAILGAAEFVLRTNEDYFVLSDCDMVFNMDLTDVIRAHAESGADITFVTKKVNASSHPFTEQVAVIESDDDGRITDFTVCMPHKGIVNLCTNIMVVSRLYLLNMLADASAHGYVSFFRDIIAHTLDVADYRVYEYGGFCAYIGSLDTYFDASMQLLSSESRRDLFNCRTRPILTKVRNSAPSKYMEGCVVRNSLVADGCVIEGTVENSILFRGVKVGRGTEVKNCILMQDSYTGTNVRLDCVITDKDVMIRDGRSLAGCPAMPFFVGKGSNV